MDEVFVPHFVVLQKRFLAAVRSTANKEAFGAYSG
jgi:hypothetical protein